MTSNYDLQKLARKNGFDVLIVTRDDLPYLRNRYREKNKNIIINLDVNGQTHWTCLHVNQGKAFYFDSFAVEPPTNILHYTKKIPLSVNNIRIQDLKSVMCGQYCIYVLKELQHNQNQHKDIWKYVLRKFDKQNFKKNDEVVKNLI